MTHPEVRDGSGHPLGGPEQVGDPPGGPGRVAGTTGTSRTGQGTLPEVRDSSGEPQGGPG